MTTKIIEVPSKPTELRPALENLRDGRNLLGAEIGVWEGKHAQATFENLDIARLYLVDPYLPYKDRSSCTTTFYNGTSNAVMVKAKDAALQILEPYRSRSRWIFGTSEDAIARMEEDCLNFVYIDGNHEYESVVTDAELWYHRICPNGLLCGHDYTRRKSPSVVEAVEDFASRLELPLFISTYGGSKNEDWWIWKPSINSEGEDRGDE